MKFLLDDDEMDGQLQRSVVAVYSGSADMGEIVVTARRARLGDYISWHDVWSALARKTDGAAEESAKSGHIVSAAKAYLRSTEYWRQAIFFIRHDIENKYLQDGWRAHRAAFRNALALLPWNAITAEVPFENASMTTYLLRPAGEIKQRPTILAPCGLDSTAEAGYAATGYMALNRGYNVLMWDGPGQGGMLYEHRVPMRPDFEVVVSTMIDWLLQQDGVSPSELVMIGRSFAGYLAPRAAAFEKRLAALVCDPGQVEMISRFIPKLISNEEWNRILAGEPEIETQLQQFLSAPNKREFFGARMATMGARTLAEFLRMQSGYTIEATAKLIQCPTLITEGEGDFASQSAKLYDLLMCEKTYHRFSTDEGAGGHCAGMGANLWESVVFDWIDNVLSGRKTSS